MRKFAPLFALLAAVALVASPLRGQEVGAFANFKGEYLRHGTVKITDGGGTSVTGKVKIRFIIATTGVKARLRISGTIKFKGALRSFSTGCIFKPKNIAVLTNVAPALDDGRGAKGTYASSPRKITADVPFVFGTTTGKGTLLLRLKKRPRGTQLIVVQTLSTSALTRPITWTFKALSQR